MRVGAAGTSLALVLALVLAGCGLPPLPGTGGAAGPPERPSGSSRGAAAAAAATALATAQATHEYPAPPVFEQVSAPAGDPVAAVRAFARAYINWTTDSVSADMRALAAASVGQARSAMALAAAQTAADYELQRAGVTNQGTVEAVAPLAGATGRYAVVTLERTTATSTSAYQGLAPAWHVAVAAVTQVAPGRWAVSGWQPEN